MLTKQTTHLPSVAWCARLRLPRAWFCLHLPAAAAQGTVAVLIAGYSGVQQPQKPQGLGVHQLRLASVSQAPAEEAQGAVLSGRWAVTPLLNSLNVLQNQCLRNGVSTAASHFKCLLALQFHPICSRGNLK